MSALQGLTEGRIVRFVGNEGKNTYPAIVTKVLNYDIGEVVLTVFDGVTLNAPGGWQGYYTSIDYLRFQLQHTAPGTTLRGGVSLTIATFSAMDLETHEYPPGTWHWTPAA